MHPFGFKQCPLKLIPPAPGQRNFSPGIDHPVPGKIMLTGHTVEYSGYLAGAPIIAGQGSHPPIGKHLSRGNSFNHLQHSLGKGHEHKRVNDRFFIIFQFPMQSGPHSWELNLIKWAESNNRCPTINEGRFFESYPDHR